MRVGFSELLYFLTIHICCAISKWAEASASSQRDDEC